MTSLRIYFIFYPINEALGQQALEETEHAITKTAYVLRSRTSTSSDVPEQTRHLRRVHTTAFVVLHGRDGFTGTRIDLFARRALMPRIGKTRVHVARHHDGYVDAELFYFSNDVDMLTGRILESDRDRDWDDDRDDDWDDWFDFD